MPFLRYTTVAADRGQRTVTTAWHYVNRQPGWILKMAAMVFLLVIALPVVLLLALASVAAVLLFGMLAIVNALYTKARGVLPRKDGRVNVRVMERRE